YLNGSGAMATGWLNLGGTWYYLNPSGGAMQTGWYKVGKTWYYSNGSGAMQTGWLRLGNTWYYMNGSGAMLTGWQKIGGCSYYFNPTSGAMSSGWVTIKGKKYYLSSSGITLTGWQQIGGKWYYFNNSGVMQTGSVTVGGSKYYLNKNGVMQTGWQKIGDNYYYFKSNGAMAVNTYMDGYYLDENGVRTEVEYGNGEWCFPCPSITYVSSEFGNRDSPGGIGSTNHKGVDLAAPANSRILAAAGGTVVNAGYGWGGEGNYVEIDHGNGLHTIYMHMISNPVVKKGQTVKASQLIGYVGMTGAATGYHLHFGVSVNGVYKNPWDYIHRPNGM
ncbi:peptidoglycan DD-metalloendopeptidase family protein, partial [Blautia sp.]